MAAACRREGMVETGTGTPEEEGPTPASSGTAISPLLTPDLGGNGQTHRLSADPSATRVCITWRDRISEPSQSKSVKLEANRSNSKATRVCTTFHDGNGNLDDDPFFPRADRGSGSSSGVGGDGEAAWIGTSGWQGRDGRTAAPRRDALQSGAGAAKSVVGGGETGAISSGFWRVNPGIRRPNPARERGNDAHSASPSPRFLRAVPFPALVSRFLV